MVSRVAGQRVSQRGVVRPSGIVSGHLGSVHVSSAAHVQPASSRAVHVPPSGAGVDVSALQHSVVTSSRDRIEWPRFIRMSGVHGS